MLHRVAMDILSYCRGREILCCVLEGWETWLRGMEAAAAGDVARIEDMVVVFVHKVAQKVGHSISDSER